jgi:hypothetical protein
MQIMAEIYQNRTAGKDQFFKKSSVAQIEKYRTNKNYIITWGTCTKNHRSIRRTGDFFMNFYSEAQKSVRDNNFPKSYLSPIRGYSWHKNKIKMIRRGHYSSSHFKDSTTRKSTKRKYGLSPKSAFL